MQLYEPIWHRLGQVASSIISSPSFAADNLQYSERAASSSTAGDPFELKLLFLHGIAVAGLRFLEDVVLPSIEREDGDGHAVVRSTVYDACPSFLTAAEALHIGIYCFAGPEGMLAQRAAAALCESIWTAGLAGAEMLITALIPYVLLASVHPETAREVDVRRVHALREAINMLDVEDESFASIKELLLLAYRSPVYLKLPEGRRFLSYILTLHPSLVREIHQVIKNNLPGSPVKVVEAYAEIYFRAWRSADGACLLALEHTCLQDYMQCAVLTSSPTTLKLCRTILDAWVQQKKQPGVDDVLLRCFNPILWRSLEVANPDVRRNAAIMFLNAFPFQKSGSSREEEEALWQKQFDALFALLGDVAPAVRVVAAQGACRILNLFWEVIPAATARLLLVKLADELVGERTCPMPVSPARRS